MAEQRATMMEPAIETLLEKVDSKFTLVTLAAKRGRQINSYFNNLGDGMGSIVPPQVTSLSRKPLSIALEEVAQDKITYHMIEEPIDVAQEAHDAVKAQAEDEGGSPAPDATPDAIA